MDPKRDHRPRPRPRAAAPLAAPPVGPGTARRLVLVGVAVAGVTFATLFGLHRGGLLASSAGPTAPLGPGPAAGPARVPGFGATTSGDQASGARPGPSASGDPGRALTALPPPPSRQAPAPATVAVPAQSSAPVPPGTFPRAAPASPACTPPPGFPARPSGIYVRDRFPGGQVALTFDDGPLYRLTEGILDVLRARRLHATFFVVGKMINARSYRVVQRILAEGHQLGNHTYHHDVYMAKVDPPPSPPLVPTTPGAPGAPATLATPATPGAALRPARPTAPSARVAPAVAAPGSLRRIPAPAVAAAPAPGAARPRPGPTGLARVEARVEAELGLGQAMVDLALLARSPREFNRLRARLLGPRAPSRFEAELVSRWPAIRRRWQGILRSRGGASPYPMRYTRPPGGNPYGPGFTAAERRAYARVVTRLGLLNILWSHSTANDERWRPLKARRDPKVVADSVVEAATRGGVLLLHDPIPTAPLAAALDRIARNPALGIVPLDDLVRRRLGCAPRHPALPPGSFNAAGLDAKR